MDKKNKILYIVLGVVAVVIIATVISLVFLTKEITPDTKEKNADELFAEGKYAEAIVLYQKKIGDGEDVTYSLYKIAQAYSNLKDADSELIYYYRVLDADDEAEVLGEETLKTIYGKIAKYYLESHNYKAASELLQTADEIYAGIYDEYAGDYSVLASVDSYYRLNTDGDIIYFGQYPSSLVVNEALKAYLDTITPDEDVVTAYGRRFAKSQGGEYYEYEPVAWKIYEDNEDNYLVISEQILDTVVYNETIELTVWNTSYLREWLNSYFYDTAFSEEEKSHMRKTTVLPSYSYIYGFTTGEQVDDDVCVFRGDIFYDIASVSYNTKDMKDLTMSKATEYSISKGIYTDAEGYGKWWLCSSGDYAHTTAMGVGSNGNVAPNGYLVNDSSVGVRPVITIVK